MSSEDGNGMRMELGIRETQVEKEVTATVAERKMDNNHNKKNDDSASVSPLVTTGDACSPIVRWERFLPKMVLRVLLVEADDSTRQIIAALLRKCSYKVVAIPDGLKAWEVLKGRSHNIDLILTEVDLPSISGFALLTLIMEHEICKSIPVIMMSSQDSVSTVYKCMLRGAADFLVKPVRKNELRNLWQHVWRRQASSSVGLGPPDESVAQQKDEATAENNAISNYSSDYMACIQRNRECIEKGTDAQSSCTKPELDAEGADTECVQELSCTKWSKPTLCDMDVQKYEKCHAMGERDRACNKDEGLRETSAVDAMRMNGEDLTSNNHFKKFLSIGQACESNGVLVKPSKQAIDLIGAFDNYLKGSNKSTGSYTGIDKVESLPVLDLSLKRSNPSGSVNQVADDRHGLIHSDASAFSRYVNKTIQARHSTSPSTCNQQNDHRTDSDKQLPSHTVNCTSDVHEQMIISPKDIHFTASQLGEAEIQFSSHQQRLLPAPIPVRGVRFQNLSNAYGSFISPVFCAHSSPMPSPGSVSYQEASYQVNSFHSLNHQTGDSQQFRDSRNQNANDATDNSENKEVNKLESAEEQGHLSSPTDRSANSSFCNGNLTHLHNLGDGNNGRIDTAPYMSSECENEEALRIRDGNSLRSLQREAALTKFRLKRKERCFEKKVRYESRKKLAEKRPRVKGQFVRQVHNETPPANSSASYSLNGQCNEG